MSNIGTTLRAMGKWNEAEAWWWKAIKLRPTCVSNRLHPLYSLRLSLTFYFLLSLPSQVLGRDREPSWRPLQPSDRRLARSARRSRRCPSTHRAALPRSARPLRLRRVADLRTRRIARSSSRSSDCRLLRPCPLPASPSHPSLRHPAEPRPSPAEPPVREGEPPPYDAGSGARAGRVREGDRACPFAARVGAPSSQPALARRRMHDSRSRCRRNGRREDPRRLRRSRLEPR